MGKVQFQGKHIIIPARLTCDGAEPIPIEIEILPYDRLGIEMIAVDFGSSVSTACFTSPKFAQDVVYAGLPKEQISELRKRLVKWFNESPEREYLDDIVDRELGDDEPTDENDKELRRVMRQRRKDELVSQWEKIWFEFVHKVASSLGYDGLENNDAVLKWITSLLKSKNNDDDFYRCWRVMASCLATTPNKKPLCAQSRFRVDLYEIYRDVFSRFPFENRSIRTAKLENNQTIVSEYCFDSPKNAFWAEGRMGQKAVEERERLELNGDSTERFFRNPKSYIYNIAKENVDASDETYSARQIIQGALDVLTSNARRELATDVSESKESIPSLILTYPVTLTAKSRSQLVKIARQLGYPRVRIVDRYDESVAPALFYLDKYFGNFDELGPETFKMQCSYDGHDVWRHNMLIVDVGAGTTDISIIQVEMTEDLFGEFNGRAYKITPTLLGALGYEQVGGNKLTLETYRVLKEILARFLVEIGHGNATDFSQEADINPDTVERYLSTYTKDQDEKILNRDNTPDYSERVKRFKWLWNWAEKVKIAFSERKKKEAASKGKTRYPDLDLYEGAPEFGLPGLKSEFENVQSEFVQAFLTEQNRNGDLMQTVEQYRDRLVFRNTRFEEIAKGFVKEILDRATDVAEKALEKRQEILQKKLGESDALLEACQGVHSVVLSGRSSRLPQIKARVEDEVSESCSNFLQGNANSVPFARPVTRILFEDEYAKTATAVGALRAEQIMRDAYVDVRDNPHIMAGRCYRYLDVKNLTHNLPSSFCANGETIFELQDEFLLCDFDGNERIRSSKDLKGAEAFKTPTHQVSIQRQIGNSKTSSNYAEFNFGDFYDGFERKKFQIQDFRVAYEIDPELNIYALITTRQNEVAYDLRKTPDQYRARIDNPEKLFTKNGQGVVLNFDVYYHTKSAPRDEILLFKKGTQLGEMCVADPKCEHKNAKKIPFVWNDEYLKVQDLNQRTLNFSYRDEKQTRGIGSIILAAEPCDKLPWEDRLRVALTSEGEFVLFVGVEPDYWETEDDEEWNESTDMVLRKNITDGRYRIDRNLDPFNGRQ